MMEEERMTSSEVLADSSALNQSGTSAECETNDQAGQVVPPDQAVEPILPAGGGQAGQPNQPGQPVPPVGCGMPEQPIPPAGCGMPGQPNQPGQPMPPAGYGMPGQPNQPGQPIPSAGCGMPGQPMPPAGYGTSGGYGMYGLMPSPPYDYVHRPSEVPAGMAIASMVLGIVSIVLCIWFYLALPCAVVGLVLGCVYKSKGGKSGMATAGIICSSVGIAFAVIEIIFYIFVYGFIALLSW